MAVFGACDAATTAPELVELMLTPPTTTLELGQTVQFRTRARLTDGTQPDVPAQYTADLGTITSAGMYTATSAGRATVTARVVTGESVTATVMVSEAPPSLDRVLLVPDTARLKTGEAVQFSASGMYDDGLQRPMTVTYEATGGAVDAAGRYTAGGDAGTYRVIARASTGQADTSVVVVSVEGGGGGAVLSSIELAPPLVTLVSGQTQQYEVTGHFTDGSTANVTEQVAFNTDGGTITSPGGFFTAAEVSLPATYSVTAHLGAFEAAATVNVVPRVLISIAVAPQTVTLQAGTSQLFSVAGTYSDGSTELISAALTATGGTITAGGLYTAGSTPGTYRVVATAATKADTATVTVTAAPGGVTLQSISLTPPSTTLAPAATRQFAVLATYSDGSTANITGSAVYSATGGTVSSSGLYTAGSTAGSYRVIATSGSRADTSAITITSAPPTLTSISLTPSSVSLASGATRQFAVTGTYSDGSNANLTGSATYAATGGTVTSGGLYTAGGTAGTGYRVIATSGGRADTSAITITASGPTVATVTVTPANATLALGASQQLAAAVLDASGSGVPGATVSWSSSAASVATVNAQGLVQAVGAGSATITASAGGKSGTAAITVNAPNNPVPVITALSPDSGSAGGATFTLTVTGTGFVGSSTVQWNGTARTTTFVSATELRATIPSSLIASAGTAQVRVVNPAPGGGTSNVHTFTVVTMPVATVTVSPATLNMTPGGQAQLTVTLRDAIGTTLTGRTITWSSSNPTVAIVNPATGMVTAVAPGSATVTATSEGKTGSTAVTVNTPPPPGNYQKVVGSDWSFGSKAELRAASYFWWYLNEDVYNYVDLVPDQTFGQVVRVHFKQDAQEGYAPKVTASFAPLDKMWYRFYVKWEPGFTTRGSNPAGYANSWKMAFWTWEGYQARGQIEFSNTDEYIIGVSVRESNGTYLRYNESTLPGHQDWGRVSTEWSDNQWWEYVVYWEKTGATTARQHMWRRRLTNNGAVANNNYTYAGWSLSGAPTPRVRAIDLGANKNKNNDSDMYLYWGPWEVVDGSRYPNPWGMNLP